MPASYTEALNCYLLVLQSPLSVDQKVALFSHLKREFPPLAGSGFEHLRSLMDSYGDDQPNNPTALPSDRQNDNRVVRKIGRPPKAKS